MVVCNDWHSALVPMLIHAEKPTGPWTGESCECTPKAPKSKTCLTPQNPAPKTLTCLQKSVPTATMRENSFYMPGREFKAIAFVPLTFWLHTLHHRHSAAKLTFNG